MLSTANNFEIAINVPVVFMVRYVMVLRSATSLRGALEGMGPEMARAKRVPFGPKKVDIYHHTMKIKIWSGGTYNLLIT